MNAISPRLSPTVYVVDDDPEMRLSLQLLVETMQHPVRTFASSSEFTDFYQAEYPGCLVLDIQMPQQSGLELYEGLLREGKRIPAIFITGHADVRVAVAAMKTGAVEFLEKPFARHTLQQRIETALELDTRWREQQVTYRELDRRIARLTNREQATLQMLLDGMPNKAMAVHLDISERAVEMRRSNIMRKLGVRSLAELVNVTVTHRILSEVEFAQRQNIDLGR